MTDVSPEVQAKLRAQAANYLDFYEPLRMSDVMEFAEAAFALGVSTERARQQGLIERSVFLLKQSQPHVCSLLCPSTRYGDEPWVHHNLCEALTSCADELESAP